jgi:tripartite-type tricarboxylate transporter receptor subunit TctC
MRPKKFDLPVILLMGGVIGLSIFMLLDLAHFESHVAGTVGPGVFPLFILLVVMAMAVLIIFKAFSPPEYRLLSPFAPGSGKGLLVNQISGLLTRETKSSCVVESHPGEGYFSAHYKGAVAAPDGKTLTVITNDQATAPNFLGASKTLEKFLPVMGVLFDPDVVAGTRAQSQELNRLSLQALLGGAKGPPIGFCHRRDFPYYLGEALTRGGREVRALWFDDSSAMLDALQEGNIRAGFLPLTVFLQNEEILERFDILAVASPERLPSLPRTPTFQELGANLVSGTWVGLGLPRGTEPSAAERIFYLLTKPGNLKMLQEEIIERKEAEYIRGPEAFYRLLSAQKAIFEELGVQEDGRAEKDRRNLYRILGTIGVFTLFILIVPFTGFIPVALVFMIAASLLLYPWRIRPALARILVTAGVVTIAVYGIFSVLFNVVFP